MKPNDKATMNNLRLQGVSVNEIAIRLHLSPNTVRSHIRRHPDIDGVKRCLTCGAFIPKIKPRRERKFCSDSCRMKWWNAHQDQVNKKAYYAHKCTHCGKAFESYGNEKRKYCCWNCYLKAKRSV